MPADPLFELPDGRRLGYAERGVPGGVPLLFFHGTPGARIVLPSHDPVARELGVRIVAPDRPGYGLSSPCADRTLRSWAHDVRALADHLGLERFAVAGASGGGPYALACAAALPERVTVAALVCTAAPFPGARHLRALSVWNRLKFGVPRWAPWLLRADLALLAPLIRARPALVARLAARSVGRGAGASDRGDPGAGDPTDADRIAQLTRLLAEAFRRGSTGLYSDLVLAGRDWDVDPTTITTPVHLWHGEADDVAPVSMARDLAAAIPRCTVHIVAGAGHQILHRPDVWRGVLRAVVAARPASR